MTSFRGFPCCTCQAEWLPAYEAELLRRGLIRHSIDIYQLIGGNPSSGGTHTEGGASDLAQISDEEILVARKMGSAAWARPRGWDGASGIAHQHGVLRGCPHNDPAAYQITALDNGFNGLGHNGEGGRDTGPRPFPIRTWKQGVAWAQEMADKEHLKDVQLDLTVATANLGERPRRDDTIMADLLEIQQTGVELVLTQGARSKVYRKAMSRLTRLKRRITGADPALDTLFLFDPAVLDPLFSKSIVPVHKTGNPLVPARFLSSQKFGVVGQKGVSLVAADTHLIARAWGKDGGIHRAEDPKDPGSTHDRRVEWRRGRDRILVPVTRRAKRGDPQVLGCDANRLKLGLNLPNEIEGRRVQKVSNGLDYLYFIDGRSHTWELVGKKRVIQTNSSHPVLIQRARLVKS